MKNNILKIIHNMRKDVFKWAWGIALIFNLDKIILGEFSLIRVHDVFDGWFPVVTTWVNNIKEYGFVTQLPESLCGISSLASPAPLAYVGTQLILPPYWNYVVYSVLMVLVAYAGMFLLLHDEFKVSKEASFIGAIFFSSLPYIFPYILSIVGIPLLVWALERIFDETYSLRSRVILYGYVIFYFLSSAFVFIGFALVPFYLAYFLFLSPIKKNGKNIISLCLIWSLYLAINLPSFTEMFFHAATSQRTIWSSLQPVTWITAARYFVESILLMILTGPAVLGLPLIIFYVLSVKKDAKDKCFYFFVWGSVLIVLLSDFIFQTPLWMAVKEGLGRLQGIQYARIRLLLPIFFSVLIGMGSEFFIKRIDLLGKKFLIITAAVILTCASGIWVVSRFPTQRLMIQLISVGVFIALLMLRKRAVKDLSVSLIFVSSFIVLAFGQLGYARVQYGLHNYFHFFRSDAIEKIKKIEGGDIRHFRVAKAGNPEPNQLLFNGFRCVDGYYNIYPLSYFEFWKEVIRPELVRSETLRDYFLSDGNNRVYLYDFKGGARFEELNFNLDLLKLINVKYLFADREIENYERYGLTKVIGKDPRYMKLPKWKKYFKKGVYYVYQNKEFAPPVFLTDSAKVFGTKDRLLDDLGKRGYAYLKRNTFVHRRDVADIDLERLSTNQARITDYRLTPDKIEVQVTNKHPVLLNWTRNYNTNWHCEIDGVMAKPFRIYNTFTGVVVPADSKVVRLWYENARLPQAVRIVVIWFFVSHIYILGNLFYVKKN